MNLIEKPLTIDDIERIKDLFLNPDLSVIKSIIYFNGWSDFEEHGGILIFKGIDDSIQLVNYGYSVMSSDNINYWDLIDIDEEKVLEEINSMEEVCKNGLVA